MNWKIHVQKLFNRFGFELHRAVPGEQYTKCNPYGYFTYSPWFEDWFKEIYEKVKDHTLVKEDRCYLIHRFCGHCLNIEGDFAECGVYKGGTAFLIALTLANKSSVQNKRLYLFDTFAGMPATANGDRSGHKSDDFSDVTLSAVKTYLQRFPFVVFQPGFIPDTFKGLDDKKFAFAHIDVDLFQTTHDCCAFFYDRMVSGGVMIFDDYGFPDYKLAAKKAVDEFFADKPETPISVHSGQCVVLKL